MLGPSTHMDVLVILTTTTTKNGELSSSGNISNICLLLPHVRAEIRTQAFALQLKHLSSGESRAHGNSSIGR